MAVPPLNPFVRITNEQGQPTPDFMQWWTAQRVTNASIVPLSTAAEVSAVVDLLGDTHGDLLFRGLTVWDTLGPGTAGFVLSTGGPAAAPVWVTLDKAFTDLTDTPATYTGAAGQAVVVNAGETALEFVTLDKAFTDLTDTPATYVGQAGRAVVVNAGETALEFAIVTAFARTLLDDVNQAAARTTLGLVPQVGATDATPGRLLLAGAFGLGGNAVPYVGDVDDNALRSGFYFAESASTGTKPVGNFGHLLVSSRASGNRVVQTWTTDTGRQFRRVYFSAAWTAWREIYNQESIIGTVSQTAGVPTGALIQRGSNANGTFVRFADGTQICWSPVLASGALTTASGSLFTSAANVTWTFPIAFSAVPVVTGHSGNIAAFIGVDPPGNTSAGFRTLATTSVAGGYNATLTASGRWF